MSTGNLDRLMDLPGARRYARYVACICPFHLDNKPSCLVYEDGFRCTACGAHGSVDRLLAQVDRRPIAPALSAPQYYPDVPRDMDNERLARSAHRMLVDKPGLSQYIIDRGLERAVRKCRLGYWDGWYTIPILSEQNNVDEIVFRAGPWVQEKTGNRFWQRSGQKPTMYVPNWKQLQGATHLFVTFGMFDAVTLSLMGHAAATSTIGKGSFKAEWLGWWDGFVVIVPDLLEEKEASVLASQLGWRGRVLRLDYPAHCKDPNDLLMHDPELLQRSIDGCYSNGRNTTSKWTDRNRAVQPGRRGHLASGAAV